MLIPPALTPGSYSSSSLYFPMRGVALHALLTSCGYSRETQARYDWHGLKRGKEEFALLQYTLDGAGRLVYEGADFAVEPGTAMLLHFPHDNRYYLPRSSSHWEFFYVCVHGAEIMRLWTAAERRAGPLLTLAADSALITAAATIVDTAARGAVISPYQSSSLAYGLTMDLMDCVRDSRHEKERPEPVAAAIRYLRATDQTVTVENMARAAGLSRFHFSRVFTASEGVSPGECIREQRIRRAARLLQTTDMSLKQVAQETGFYDATYFCKAFRSLMGITPRSFRQSGMYGAAGP